jgi:hypothetical protein
LPPSPALRVILTSSTNMKKAAGLLQSTRDEHQTSGPTPLLKIRMRIKPRL